MHRPSAHHVTSLAASALALALPLLGACQQGGATPAAPSERIAVGRGEGSLPGGLAQIVTLTPASPTANGEVTVRSVIVNRGGGRAEVEWRLCGLDYAGTLGLTNPPAVFKCAAYSASAAIEPGDSVVTSDLMLVSSPPGAYELRVRHALRPEAWVTVPVTVTGP